MKAIQLPHYKRKLNSLSKQLFKDHNWRLPVGYIDKQLTDPKNFTLDEWQQAKRVEKDPRQIKQVFQQAWKTAQQTDNPAQAFSDTLKQHGYQLAQGKRRAVVAVDEHGEIYSVPRQLGIKSKEVKAVFGNDLSNLPDADHLKVARQQNRETRLVTFKDAALKKSEEDKQAFKDKLAALIQKQRQERAAQTEHHTQRQIDEAKIRRSRFRKGVKGLWDRLCGEHAKTSKQNELQAKQAAKRDAREKETLIRKQLWERGQLRKERDQAKQKLKLQDEQKAQLVKYLEQGKKWQKSNLDLNLG